MKQDNYFEHERNTLRVDSFKLNILGLDQYSKAKCQLKVTKIESMTLGSKATELTTTPAYYLWVTIQTRIVISINIDIDQ